MTPFAIAGIQMHIGQQDNIAAMEQRLELAERAKRWTSGIHRQFVSIPAGT